MENIDEILADYIQRFIDSNSAALNMANHLKACGIGLNPLIDHCTIRTHNVDQRAKQFLDLGYKFDNKIGTLEFESWWAKVYRKPGYPALFIDQAFEGKRGEPSLIPNWVNHHGDQCFHHIALLVEDIEQCIQSIQKRGFDVAGEIIGNKDSDLRQVFTKPEIKNGEVYTVLELIERHNGYEGFLPPQADSLMESSRLS